MIKLDIVNRVADRTGVPKMKAEQAVEALFHSMKEALMRGERIELRGFGVFVVKPRKRPARCSVRRSAPGMRHHLFMNSRDSSSSSGASSTSRTRVSSVTPSTTDTLAGSFGWLATTRSPALPQG